MDIKIIENRLKTYDIQSQQNEDWKNKKIDVNKKWLLEQLAKKIKTIDWKKTQEDVARFLRPREAESLNLWSEDFFLKQLDKLNVYLD